MNGLDPAWMRARRVALGMSQRDLAYAMGAAQNSLSEFENGVHVPSWPMLARWCEALDLRLTMMITPKKPPADSLTSRQDHVE